jgi:hypothetical protein
VLIGFDEEPGLKPLAGGHRAAGAEESDAHIDPSRAGGIGVAVTATASPGRQSRPSSPVIPGRTAPLATRSRPFAG